jgi:predicted O-linked N-acetylglucosamine transferase (SPINDLY family)
MWVEDAEVMLPELSEQKMRPRGGCVSALPGVLFCFAISPMPTATVQQTFALALQHHQAGRLADAEALYRQILAVQPVNADAVHNLGVVAQQSGRCNIAVELFGKAIALDPANAVAYSNLGEAYRASGRLPEALEAYRQALRLDSRQPYAHNNLGTVLRVQGRLEEAIDAFREALQLRPDYAEAHYNLAVALEEAGRWAEALAPLRQAIEIKPDLAEAYAKLGNVLVKLEREDEAVVAYVRALEIRAEDPATHNNLGNLLKARGEQPAAVAAFRRALTFNPEYAEAHYNLGNALAASGDFAEAATALRRALKIRPDYFDAWNNLGNVLAGLGQLDEACAAFGEALRLRPDAEGTWTNLGNVLVDLGRLGEAIEAYRQAIELQPDYAVAHNNLGNVYRMRGQLDEAMEWARRALGRKPDFADGYINLGNAFKDGGQIDEAIGAYREAIRLNPNDAGAHGNLVYTLLFQARENDERIVEEQAAWNRRFAEPVRRDIQPHANDSSPERRLRIGYVSPHFRQHVVGGNLVPLFRHHDHVSFDVFCYSGVVRPDELTDEFRRHADHWRSTVGVGDEALAEMIRADEVDILVDLTQHLAGNRLPLFARQPAPVQASFAGYPASAGVDGIGYRISDRWLGDGTETGWKSHSALQFPHSEFCNERVFLVESFWCYQPTGAEAEVSALPALENGLVTFGSLNNFCKVNDKMLKAWARLLRALPGSRLIMLSPEGTHRQRTITLFAREGIELSRVEFRMPCARGAYLELYHVLDIALDPFPYNGHTTSLDALWMGVPVISLAGKYAVSRAGLSQLSNLGLPELVAYSEDQYVDIAERLAQDVPRLVELRRTLRNRMEASVLMDARRFARGIETGYRAMWRQWCGERSD